MWALIRPPRKMTPIDWLVCCNSYNWQMRYWFFSYSYTWCNNGKIHGSIGKKDPKNLIQLSGQNQWHLLLDNMSIISQVYTSLARFNEVTRFLYSAVKKYQRTIIFKRILSISTNLTISNTGVKKMIFILRIIS